MACVLLAFSFLILSAMGNVMKRYREQRVEDTKERIKTTVMSLRKMIVDVELKRDHTRALARDEHLQGRPRSASNRLILSKHMDKTVDSLHAMELKLVVISNSLDSSEMMKEVLGTLKFAVGTLSMLSNGKTLKELRKVQDELDEITVTQEEIDSELESGISTMFTGDTSELEQELEELSKLYQKTPALEDVQQGSLATDVRVGELEFSIQSDSDNESEPEVTLHSHPLLSQ